MSKLNSLSDHPHVVNKTGQGMTGYDFVDGMVYYGDAKPGMDTITNIIMHVVHAAGITVDGNILQKMIAEFENSPAEPDAYIGSSVEWVLRSVAIGMSTSHTPLERHQLLHQIVHQYPAFMTVMHEMQSEWIDDPKQLMTSISPRHVSFGTNPCEKVELVIIRPNIEHNMLGIVMGRGGLEDLGATLWGQTELSVYDDSMHGIWGMSYKYNERAIVYKEKNLIRLWDVAYDGYNGGKDCRAVDWTNDESTKSFQEDTYDMNKPYEGASMMVMSFPSTENTESWPSPIVFYDNAVGTNTHMPLDGEHASTIDTKGLRVFNRPEYQLRYQMYYDLMPEYNKMHNVKQAGASSQENETSCCNLAFQGSMKVYGKGMPLFEESGNGHHGPDYVGAASVRSGKGIRPSPDSITNARIM